MTKSHALFQSANQYIPGGVNSPVRAFRGVGGDPVFIKRAYGPYIVDADENEYVDYVGSWGPMIAGHTHPHVLEAVTAALHNGFSFGAPTEIEVKLAERVTQLMPSIEMVRFVSSGTEATMSAIRLARGFTKRNKIIKFAGCYHGHADSLLVAAGSGVLTLGVPGSAGVPDSIAAHTLTATYNRLDEVAALLAKYGDDVACIIVEPVAGNMNMVQPKPGFLAGLRELCNQYGVLLIFDEVMTGFRIALGGAQAHFNIKPDLTTLGKIIGGGFPVAAFGGRADVMHAIAPLGPVYQAGTLSGNPIAMTAGLAMLDLITLPGFYDELAAKTAHMTTRMQAIAHAAGVPFRADSIGGMFGFYFTAAEQIETEADIKQCDVATFKRFFHGMLKKGIYLAPSAFEAGFVSQAHTEKEFAKTFAAATEVFANLHKEQSACIESSVAQQA